MTNEELIKALRYCISDNADDCDVCPYQCYCKSNGTGRDKMIRDAAAALEAAEAQLPKEGEWIYEDLDNFRKYKVTCPHCGAWYVGNYDAYDEPSDFNYCPHCGNICNPANLAWEKELSERERKEQNDGES